MSTSASKFDLVEFVEWLGEPLHLCFILLIDARPIDAIQELNATEFFMDRVIEIQCVPGVQLGGRRDLGKRNNNQKHAVGILEGFLGSVRVLFVT